MACSQAWRSSAVAGLGGRAATCTMRMRPAAAADVDMTAGSHRAAVADNDRSVRAVGGQAGGILDQREPEAPTHAGPDLGIARLAASELGRCFRAENTHSVARPATEHHLVERREVRCRGEPRASGARDPLRVGMVEASRTASNAMERGTDWGCAFMGGARRREDGGRTTED